MYEAHRGECIRLVGAPQPFWHELSFEEQCEWQEEADAQNNRDKETHYA